MMGVWAQSTSGYLLVCICGLPLRLRTKPENCPAAVTLAVLPILQIVLVQARVFYLFPEGVGMQTKRPILGGLIDSA